MIYGPVNTASPEALPEEQYQRILHAPEMTYLHIQAFQNDASMSELVKRRVIELRQADKKIILQVFYGPGQRYNWSYHSIAAIGRDPEVAADFMIGFDAVIDSFGAENLYGVVLMEENGHFGFDIDQPGDWNMNRTSIVSGAENNSAGDNYQNYEAFGGAWSARAPNVLRFKDHLKQIAGIDLTKATTWNREQNDAFGQWRRRDLYGSSQRAVADHMRHKYPQLKFFLWDIRLGFAHVATAWDFLDESTAQGFIADPYASTLMNYYAFANLRTLHPNAELVALLWGGYASRDVKARRFATAYICGASGLGFFEGSGTDASGQVFMRSEGKVIAKADAELAGAQAMDYADPETFALNRELAGVFAKLPPFQLKPRTLIVSGDIVSNGTTAMEWTQSFYDYPAHCNTAEAHRASLDNFDLLVIHHNTPLVNQRAFTEKYGIAGSGIDGQALDEFVKRGGLAVIYGLPDGWDKTFLGRLLHVRAEADEQAFQGVFEPSEWLRENLGLTRNYKLNVARRALKAKPAASDYGDDLVRVLSHGKGRILWLAFTNKTALVGDVYHPDEFRDHVQLLHDLTYGFCAYARDKEMADREINDPALGLRYLRASDPQTGVTCVLLKDDVPAGKMTVRGFDLLGGGENPVLDKNRTVAVIVPRSGGE